MQLMFLTKLQRLKLSPKFFNWLLMVLVFLLKMSIVYSDQLMEHLHHSDAIDNFKTYTGTDSWWFIYIFVTPNQFVWAARCFEVLWWVAAGSFEGMLATGLLWFRTAGFSKDLYKSYKQSGIKLPLIPITVFISEVGEEIISSLPFYLGKKNSKYASTI